MWKPNPSSASGIPKDNRITNITFVCCLKNSGRSSYLNFGKGRRTLQFSRRITNREEKQTPWETHKLLLGSKLRSQNSSSVRGECKDLQHSEIRVWSDRLMETWETENQFQSLYTIHECKESGDASRKARETLKF
jgi:hypothetical protein